MIHVFMKYSNVLPKIDLYCLITGEAIYEIGEAHKEIHSRVEENVGSAYSLMEILSLIIFVIAIVKKQHQ